MLPTIKEIWCCVSIVVLLAASLGQSFLFGPGYYVQQQIDQLFRNSQGLQEQEVQNEEPLHAQHENQNFVDYSSRQTDENIHFNPTIRLLHESQTNAIPPKSDAGRHKDEFEDHLAFRSALESSMATHKSITCPELNNATFTNEPPFDALGIPECGPDVYPNFELYAPSDNKTKINVDTADCMLLSEYLPNGATTKCYSKLTSGDHPKLTKVVVIIHGYLKTFTSSTWMHDYRRQIQLLEPGTACILVGWDKNTWSFWKAAANTRYIAMAMYQLLKELRRVIGPSYDSMPIHCIGHSLGAHACGFAGKHLIADPDTKTAKKLHRISGLDPAGPLFANDVPYPFDHLHISPAARLGPHDADIVDCVHTDGHARYLGFIPQYGTLEPLGQIDFYPGQSPDYGHDQPGCLVNIVSCSHSRAHDIFGVTIANAATCAAAGVCHGDPKDIPKNCRKFNGKEGEKVTMGYWWHDPKPGIYIIDEVKTEPYCVPPKN